MSDGPPPVTRNPRNARMIAFRGFCSLALAMLLSSRAESGDWPEFRGPTGQGHSTETNLPLRWSDTENVRWKVDVAGEGWSSPIVVGGSVYMTTAVPTTDDPRSRARSLRLVCLDAATGGEVFNVEVFRQDHATTQPIQSKNSHASPTPLCDGEHIYVHFGAKGTACLTLDGDIVWRNRELIYDPRHGNGGSPILVGIPGSRRQRPISSAIPEDASTGRLREQPPTAAGKQIVVSCDGYDIQFVVAIDCRTGRIRWRKDRPQDDDPKQFAFATALLIEVDGQQQVVSPGAHSVVAYDPDDGRELWMVRHPGYSVVPRPVFAHGLVYVCTSFNDSQLLAIRPDGRGDVTDTHVVWRHTRAVPHTPSLLAIGDELYLISDRGIASCLDAVSGRVHWTERIGGNFSASPLFADGRIYLQSEQGESIVFTPGREYTELARSRVAGRTLASLAAAESALFLRTDKQLLRIEKSR